MVPRFQAFMKPYLLCLKDGETHTMKELVEFCFNYLKLTDDDKKEQTKRGNNSRLYDRTQWSGTYLRKANAVESPKRGTYRITERGLKLLAENPDGISLKTLCQFKEFVEFSKRRYENPDAKIDPIENVDKTPLEIMDDAFSELTKELAEELLEMIKAQTPEFFENLVVKLLVAMGYGGSFEDAASVTKASHDEGIDGIIKEDKLGLDSIYVQAKRYDKGTVGRKDIQSFVGALTGKGANKGVFITTSTFTKEAINFEPKNSIRIVLIDGVQLAKYMIDFNIGVSTKQTYDIKRIDLDFFEQ